MNLKSFQKLSYDKQLAMAEEMQEFVSLMKAQHFDPYADYDFATCCDFKVTDRGNMEIMRVPSLAPDYTDKMIRPVQFWYLNGKKGQGKTDRRLWHLRERVEKDLLMTDEEFFEKMERDIFNSH